LATAVFAAGCGKDPEVAKRGFVNSGDAFVAQKKYAEAVIQYRNAVQQDARYGEARAKLADTYALVGDVEGAMREAVRAADLLPTDATAQVRAGIGLLGAHKYEDALSRADKALAINPKLVDAQLIKGYALGHLKKLD